MVAEDVMAADAMATDVMRAVDATVTDVMAATEAVDVTDAKVKVASPEGV